MTDSFSPGLVTRGVRLEQEEKDADGGGLARASEAVADAAVRFDDALR